MICQIQLELSDEDVTLVRELKGRLSQVPRCSPSVYVMMREREILLELLNVVLHGELMTDQSCQSDPLVGRIIVLDGKRWAVLDVCVRHTPHNQLPDMLYSLELIDDPLHVRRLSKAKLTQAIAHGSARVVGSAVVLTSPHSPKFRRRK